MKNFRTILAYDYSLAEVLVDRADEFEQRIARELWPDFLKDIAARRFTEILTAEEMQTFDQILSEVLNIPSAKEAVTPKLLKIRGVFLPSLIQTLEELYPEAKKLITRYKIEKQSPKDEPFSYRDYAEGLIRAKKRGNPRLYERFYERLRKEVARTEDESQEEDIIVEEVEEDFNPVEVEKDLQNIITEGTNYYIEQPQLQQRWLEAARNHITHSFQQDFGVRHIVRTLRDLLETFKKQLPNALYEKTKKAQLKRNYDYGGDHLDRIREMLRKKRRKKRAELLTSLKGAEKVVEAGRNYPDPFLWVLLKEYQDGVSIKELARLYDISPYKLIKRFKDMGYVKPPTTRIPRTKEEEDKRFLRGPSELQMLKDQMLSEMKERKELQARLKNLRNLLG